MIRQQEKELQQAQFFYKELKKMQLKEDKEKKAFESQQALDKVGTRINELENVEMEMLSNLKNTVNEHNRLLQMAQSGNLDFDSILKS